MEEHTPWSTLAERLHPSPDFCLIPFTLSIVNFSFEYLECNLTHQRIYT